MAHSRASVMPSGCWRPQVKPRRTGAVLLGEHAIRVHGQREPVGENPRLARDAGGDESCSWPGDSQRCGTFHPVGRGDVERQVAPGTLDDPHVLPIQPAPAPGLGRAQADAAVSRHRSASPARHQRFGDRRARRRASAAVIRSQSARRPCAAPRHRARRRSASDADSWLTSRRSASCRRAACSLARAREKIRCRPSAHIQGGHAAVDGGVDRRQRLGHPDRKHIRII